MREQQGASVSFQRGAWSGGRGKWNGRGEKERGESKRKHSLRSLARAAAGSTRNQVSFSPSTSKTRTHSLRGRLRTRGGGSPGGPGPGPSREARSRAEKACFFFFCFVPLFFLDGGRLGKKKSELFFSFLPFLFRRPCSSSFAPLSTPSPRHTDLDSDTSVIVYVTCYF